MTPDRDPYEGLGTPIDPYEGLGTPEPTQNYFADKARRIGREIPKVIGDIVASPGSAIESGTELLAEGMRRVAVKRGDLTPEEATQKKQEFLDRASREPAGQAAATAREVGQQLRDVGPRQFAAPDPARNGEIGSAVASGAASLVPLLAAGSVAPLAAIPAAAGMMGEQQRQDAEEKGATPTQQAAAFALGAPVGAASEALLGVPALLKSVAAAKPAAAALGAAGTGLEAMATGALGKLAPAILPVAKQAVKSAVREGVQEGLEQIAQNTIAKDVVGYDPTRDRTEGAGMAMVGGAIVGGGVGAAHQAAADLDPRNRAQRDLDEALQAQRAAEAKKLAREQAQPEPTTTAAPAQPSAESSGQPAPAPSRPSLVAELLAQDAQRAAAEREAAAKEVAERTERQKELADKKARFDERIALARQAYADPAATYADIEGARKTIAFYADDNSLGLTQQQREQAIAAESALSTKAAQLKPAFEAQTEQERITREQTAAAEATAQKAARSEERAALRHLAATGRDRATGLIADLARVPAEELQALDLADPKNRLADGTALDEPRVLAELERRAQDEERAAATATNRGEELGDVLRRVKIPSSSETLGTELSDLIREGMTDRQRMTLLSGKPGELDRTAETLRAEGFPVDTPADVIDLLDRHLRGEKIYGDKPDDLQFARQEKTAPTAPAALTDDQVAAQFDTLRRTLGRTAREFDLQAGIVADVLEREGYAKEAAALRAGRLGSIQAGTGPRLREKIDALRAQQRFIVVAAEAARRGEAPGLVLHELAHPFFDALPTETRALMREMHAEETGSRTGPLYRDGKKTTKIAITADSLPPSRVKADPDLPVKEWFAERVRALNAEWLDGRMQTEQRPLIIRLWRQMLDRLQALFAQVRGLERGSDLFTDTFRDWLRTGTKEDITRTSLAYARQRRAEFANFQDTLDLGSTPLGLNLPNEIRNLSPRWQDKTLIFDSSLDKALYYAGGTNSETRARVTQAIAEQTKLTPGQIATLARDLRQQIAPLARNAASDGTVRVPAQMRAKARQLTGIDFASESGDYVARNGTPDEKAPAARADIEQLLRTVNDDQLDLFDYARGSRAVERSEAPQRDDGRPAQLQREADALKNPTNSAALRAAYGLEGEAAQQTTRISSIIPELIKDPKRTWDIRGARIESPRDLLTLINVMRTPYVETTKMILLNDKNEVVHSEVLSVGAISAAMLDANMIARVISRAPQSDLGYNVILSHNHPSGNPAPSAADTSVTRALREVLRNTKHQLKDHVVTNGDTYYSYAENGYTDTSGKNISQVTPEKRGTDADQKVPIGALAPWEKIARAELPFTNRSETTMEILGALRQVDPSALHIIYLNRKYQIMAFERMPDFKLPLDSSVDPIGTTVFEGLGREGAVAFILGAPDTMPTIEAARLMRSMREFAKTANFEFLDYTAKTFTGDTTARLMGVLEEPTNDPQARLADVEQRIADLANSQEDATEIDARGKALSAERDQIKREIAAEEQQAATAAALRPASEIKATDTERSQRHPAAIADPEPGDAWAMTPKMEDAQLEQERKAITRYIGDRYTELSAIERALLNARIDALKAEQDRRVIDAAPRVEALPKVDRQAALEGELRRGRELRDEGSRTGNATAEAEGVRLVRLATERLDEEFPGWDKKKAATPPEPPEPPKDTAESAQPDDQEPSPFDRPEREIPVRAGKFDEIYGQDTYHPTPLAKTWQKAREALAGFRGPIPELPTFPNAWWNRADQFIRDHGPQFYNRIKEGVRALNSGNDYIQRTAEEQVARITTPLLKAGNKLDATNYARLSTLQEKARRLTAEQKPIPRSMRAEISALNRQLESSPYVLFNRLVLALDLNWRHENLKDDQGRPISLPANVNAAELRAELARLGERIEASGHKEIIRTALEQHMAMVKQIGNDLRARELLADTHLSNPYYFPHITLETTRGGKTEQRELRPQRVRPGTEADFRGYLVTPVGSAKPISTDYVRSMYYHLVQVGAHNFKADAVRDFFRPYDVMKAVRDRAKELSRSRGVPVSWQQAFAEEYAPRGYVLYGTDSRDAFPTVSIDRDKLARRMGVMLTSDDLHQQLADLGLKGIKLLPEDLTETLQQGARETWVLPARVAESLRGVADRMQANDGAVDAAAKWTLGKWKAWKLFMPWNHVRYEYGNIVADAEKIFSASPSTIRQLPAAFREIRDFWQGKEPGADLRAALKEGVINAITAQELGSLNRMKAFEDFQTRTERLQNQLVRRGSSIVYQPITNLLGLGDLSAPELSAFREGVTRYAKYKADLEAIRNGTRPNYAGAYWRDIEAIQDSRMGAKDAAERKAAAISKATFGDYGDLSINGQYIRDRLVPFYSWMEINFRYHANLLRNLHDMVRAGEKSRTEALGAGTRAAAVAAAGFTARAAGGVALRLALPYMAVALWNSTDDRDDLEKLLSEEDRRRFHIIIGKTKDGNTTLRDGRKIEVLYGQTALQDVTKWFSGAKFMQAMGQWMNGKTDFPTAFSTWRDQLVPDFLNNTIGSAGPYGKIPYALLSGKNTFPDITDQRTIPAYDMRRHILGQITDEFTADQIETAINKDYYGSKDVGDWARQLVLQVRQRDPDQWAFYSIKDKAAKFVEQRTGQKRDSAFDAPDQQVLRNFKRAIYRGDVEKAVQFYQRLLDYGYTSERFAASIRSQDPLSTLPKENGLRAQFVASLTPDDRAQLDRAYAYYERMATSRGREPLLFPSQQAGANGVRRYQAAPRTEQLRAMMEQTGRMTDEEREARMQRDLRRSLQRN